MITKIGDYKGHEVTLTKEKLFFVKGPLFDNGRLSAFDTWANAEAEIDKRTKTEAKAKERGSLGLKVMTFDGIATEIKGIHSRQANLLFADGALSRKAGPLGGIRDVYPDIPWLRQLTTHIDSLRRTVKAKEQELGKYAIRVQRDHTCIRSAEMVEAEIDNLKAEHASKLASAQAVGEAKMTEAPA